MEQTHFSQALKEEQERRAAIEQDLNLRLRQQETIAALGEFALNCKDLDSLFYETVERVSKTLDMEFCKILQLLPGGKELFLRAGVGWKEGMVGHTILGAERNSQAGYALLSNEPVIVQDLREETRFSDLEMLAEHRVISGMTVVIPGDDSPFGALGVHTASKRTFYPHDTRFIKAIASILASAIERSKAEEELRQSRDRLAVILHGITEGVTVQGNGGEIVYANQAAAELLGYPTAEELLAAPLPEIMQQFILEDEEGHQVGTENLPGRLVLQGAKRASSRIRFRVRTTGEVHWSLVEATPIYDFSGKVIQTVNIFRDITEFIHSAQYQKFLAEASVLLASSLDYKITLSNVAQMAVSNLADWCSVYLMSDNNEPTRLIIAHKNPQMMDLALEYQKRYPLNLSAETGIGRIFQTGQPEYYPEITDAMLEAVSVDRDHLELIRKLGMHSAIFVPLTVRGKTFGAISLIWAESGYRFTQRDVDLANELAHRAALAIDNARLYQEAQSLNTELEKRVKERTHELERTNGHLAREVEERRKTEQALQKSEAVLNSLFESAPDAMILVDLQGKIIRVNRQTEVTFGYIRDELVNQSIDGLIPVHLRARHSQKRIDYLQERFSQPMGTGLELNGQRKDGSEFLVDIMLSPVTTDQGEMIICAVRDITEQKRLQNEVDEVHRRLLESIEEERLMISQELHDGPIQDLYATSINLESFNEMVGANGEDEGLQSAKDGIQSVIQTLREICGELRPPILSHFGLEKAIRSHLGKIRDAHPEITFETQLDSDGPLLSERARLALYRVYQNSISNIIRHAQATHVTIGLHIGEGEVHFLIEDNGHGFNVPRKWINLAREGHFGLVGMTERVQAIGGKMVVESKIGKGTTIQVTVPLEQQMVPDA